jgi:FtsZ-binding cell division protein ZapB
MSNQSAAANVHSFMRTSSAPDPDASDPLPIMRREMTLLRIEIEQLRGKEDEAHKMKEFLLAYVERVEHLRANRDQWQREAERLNALIAQVPHWSLFWARCCFDAWKAWRKLTGLRPARVVAGTIAAIRDATERNYHALLIGRGR